MLREIHHLPKFLDVDRKSGSRLVCWSWQLANRLYVSPQAALYCLVLGLGNTVVLNGTKQDERMRADLEALEKVRKFSEERPEEWKSILQAFQMLVGDPVT